MHQQVRENAAGRGAQGAGSGFGRGGGGGLIGDWLEDGTVAGVEEGTETGAVGGVHVVETVAGAGGRGAEGKAVSGVHGEVEGACEAGANSWMEVG